MILQKNDRNLAALIFATLILTYCLFLQSVNNDNAMSREAVALSIVRQGTLTINCFQRFTVDKAYFHNRFYSDKAPGMAILAMPAVYAAHFILKTLGRDRPVIENQKPTSYFTLYTYLSTVLTSGLFTAAAAATLFLTARGLGATAVGALFGALSYGLATPAFGWATAFFGHATAGACLFMAFAAIIALQDNSSGRRHPLALGCTAGGLLGLAMIVEFTTIPAAAVIALFALRTAISLDRGERRLVLTGAVICGTAMLILLGLYNYFAFGSPVHLGYESVVGFAGMKQGLMGIGIPKPIVLLQILFGRYRGLFTVSPILLLSFWSLVNTWRKGLLRTNHFICISAIVTSFLTINSGYYYWDGGWAVGPRFLTPMIVFLCLPLALEWSSAGDIFRVILIVAFAVSTVICLAATAVGMTADSIYVGPINFRSPLTEFIFPKFLNGSLYSSVFWSTQWPSWSVAVPLIVIWVSTTLIARQLLRDGRND